MKTFTCILIAGAGLARVCSGQEPALPASPTLATVKQSDARNNPSAPAYTDPPETLPMTIKNFGGKDPILTPEETAGIGITQTWVANSLQAMSPDPGPDGAIQFRYGAALPVIVCAPFQVTDLELQAGETAEQPDIHCGDPKRWSVETSFSGEGDGRTQHLFIEPTDNGLETTLDITTNRRTYHVALASHSVHFMHLVRFLYSDAPVASARPVSTPKLPEPKPEKPSGGPGVKVAYEEPVSSGKRPPSQPDSKAVASDGDSDHYWIEGKAPWRPVSAYHTSSKTYLEMPRGMANTEAPALFLLRKSGPFGWGSQKLLTNYRVHGKWYVVDSIIDRAVLVAGVGGNQDKITITREK
jgi:P-type conjugative transfer protein TrbG